MYETVLVAVDGSEESFTAARGEVDLTAEGGTLHALSVVELIPMDTRSRKAQKFEDDDGDAQAHAEESVSEVESLAEPEDVDCVTAIEEGVPRQVIISYANEIGADAIVVGKRGLQNVTDDPLVTGLSSGSSRPAAAVERRTGCRYCLRTFVRQYDQYPYYFLRKPISLSRLPDNEASSLIRTAVIIFGSATNSGLFHGLQQTICVGRVVKTHNGHYQCPRSAATPDGDRDNSLCDTAVSHTMSTDTNAGDDRMEKLNVRVPEAILTQIDEEWERRGYASRSEAIRDALRDWLDPSPELSDEILDELEESREQRERGDTVSADEARRRLGLDDSESEE